MSERHLPALVEPFKPKEMSRLGVLQHVLTRINETKQENRNGERNNFGKTINGRMVETYFSLDERFTTIWTEKMQNMYEMEFMGNPVLSEAAYNIADVVRNEPKTMTPGELVTLFERE